MFSNASCDGSLRPQLGQRRADRLGRFVARNIVAAEAAVAAERAAGDVLELPLRAIRRSFLNCPSSTCSSTFTVAGRADRECLPSQISRPAVAGTTR